MDWKHKFPAMVSDCFGTLKGGKVMSKGNSWPGWISTISRMATGGVAFCTSLRNQLLGWGFSALNGSRCGAEKHHLPISGGFGIDALCQKIVDGPVRPRETHQGQQLPAKRWNSGQRWDTIRWHYRTAIFRTPSVGDSNFWAALLLQFMLVQFWGRDKCIRTSCWYDDCNNTLL